MYCQPGARVLGQQKKLLCGRPKFGIGVVVKPKG